MSWTDRSSIECIKQLRDIFNVKVFVETGTFKAMNVLAHKDNFNIILSCEKIKEYYDISKEKCKNINNIGSLNMDSKEFLNWFVEKHKNAPDKNNCVIFYLDAHFYDKKRPKGKGKFVVLDELKQLKGFKKCIIIIHDFDNNLGHITYDGISLNLELLKKDLLKVNPKFKFYTNELASCDIMKPFETDDSDMRENLEYAWSKPEKTFRGILYCLPKKVNVKGLREIK